MQSRKEKKIKKPTNDETSNGKNPTKILVSGVIEKAGLDPQSEVIHVQRGIYILLISTNRWYFK